MAHQVEVDQLRPVLVRSIHQRFAAVAAGVRIPYSKAAADAPTLVETGADGADAAFLLEPTPVASILAVARDGDVMPQKSTYFYPKALTGLVLNPHEW